MSKPNDSLQELRGMSQAELLKLGEDSLKQRLREQAVLAHLRHGGLTTTNLEAFLNDPECVRYPTRLVYEFGEMAMHQFAQPDLDHRNPDQDGRVLYLRPMLRERPDLVVLAVAYMTPSINYGDLITDEHCVLYGATLLGLMEEEFYSRICALADLVGSEVKLPGQSSTECGGPAIVCSPTHDEKSQHHVSGEN
jgi:hypothetical protein